MLSEARPQTCRAEPTGWELNYAKGVAMIGQNSGDYPMWCHPCNVKSFSSKEPDVFDSGVERDGSSSLVKKERRRPDALNNSPQQGNEYLSLRKKGAASSPAELQDIVVSVLFKRKLVWLWIMPDSMWLTWKPLAQTKLKNRMGQRGSAVTF